MELLDIVDENNNLTGEVCEREYVHNNGLRHRESAVLVINEKNELLLEKRAATKKSSPNKWALCAGHVSSGEDPEDTMIRELKEEIGMNTTAQDLIFLDIYEATNDEKKR